MTQPTLFGADAPPLVKGAALSPCGLYRYRLWRRWGPDESNVVCWVMLNPSRADADRDDHTAVKVRGFSELWGYDGYVVVNLYAFRSTDPRELWRAADPVGPENDRHIAECVRSRPLVVCAWGANAAKGDRAARVLGLLAGAGVKPRRLGPLTKGGHPGHPLRLPYSLAPEPLEGA